MANYSLPQDSNGTIPLPEAIEQTANWRAYIAGTDLITRSLLFDIETVNNMLRTNPDADGIRVYLALKTAGDPASLSVLLVPVIDGVDVPTLPKPGTVGDEGDADDNVFNWSIPCPPGCPDDSPLG